MTCVHPYPTVDSIRRDADDVVQKLAAKKLLARQLNA